MLKPTKIAYKCRKFSIFLRDEDNNYWRFPLGSSQDFATRERLRSQADQIGCQLMHFWLRGGGWFAYFKTLITPCKDEMKSFGKKYFLAKKTSPPPKKKTQNSNFIALGEAIAPCPKAHVPVSSTKDQKGQNRYIRWKISFRTLSFFLTLPFSVVGTRSENRSSAIVILRSKIWRSAVVIHR